MKMGKTLKDIEDKLFGKKGTHSRDLYEKEISDSIDKVEESDELEKNDQEDLYKEDNEEEIKTINQNWRP